MPRGDRTGPWGRGAGYCAGYDMPGFANPIPGYGRRFGGGFGGWGGGFGGWGGGRGWRRRYFATGYPVWERAGYPPITAEQEMASLRDEAEWLKGQLEAINRRIEDLEGKE